MRAPRARKTCGDRRRRLMRGPAARGGTTLGSGLLGVDGVLSTGAGTLTGTVATADAVLPVTSVTVTVPVCWLVVANECVAAGPVALAPSSKLHAYVSESPTSRSPALAAKATGTPGSVAAGVAEA